MKNYYLIFSTGRDRAGIVAAVSEVLFKNGCNLEDSSMMKLGGEFGIFLIFTSRIERAEKSLVRILEPVKKRYRLTLSLKKISKTDAEFNSPQKGLFLVKVMGEDKAGIVFRVCQFLFRHHFNILDLETHRTAYSNMAGYILFIEGNFRSKRDVNLAKKDLGAFQKLFGLKVQIDPVPMVAI